MKIDLVGEERQKPGQTHAVFVIIPRFNIATLVTMIETMRIANYLSSQRHYSWEVTSFDGTTITASNGMQVSALESPPDLKAIQQVFVLGSWGGERYENLPLISWLRRASRAGIQICAVELGCYILARAGLLANKKATTHWSWISGFQENFIDVDVVEQLFTIDGRIMTCAGGMAGIDLMLRLIESSIGGSLSGEVADQMIHHPIRSETKPQRITLGQSTETILPIIREAIDLVERNIEEPLTVPEIAKTLGMSQRQLERLFKKYIGCTVVQFGLLLRLQKARLLLISTNMSVREVATASGFNTLSHFAYAFGNFFDRRPSEYREAWPQDEDAPSWPGTLTEFLASLRAEQNNVHEAKGPNKY